MARQKRKLDEMYDQLRSEYESMKRTAIQPANNFYSRAEPDLFESPANMMGNRDTLRKGNSVLFIMHMKVKSHLTCQSLDLIIMFWKHLMSK